MPFTSDPLHFLVVEDNIGDFVLFESYLQQTSLRVKDLYHAKCLSEIFVPEEKIDIAFLDLTLPDSGGVESFVTLNQRLPHVPIVVLSGLANQAVALQCITLGAQDYLIKNELNERLLEKSVYYSIERKKNLEQMRMANRQYELIGSVTNDVIWNWDLETNEITCSKKCFLGYAYDEEGETLDWWMDKIHPDDKQQVSQAIHSILEKRSTSLQVEYRFLSGQGAYQSLFIRGTLLPAKANESHKMIGSIMDITERKKLENELLAAQLNIQRQMTEAMLLGQEKQKEEIGKELHDNINQILASAKLYIETAITNAAMKDELLAICKENIVYAIDEIRKLSHSLAPPSFGDYGLIEAIADLMDELNAIGLFKASLQTDSFDEAAIDSTQKLMLYRIVQEQINNIIKYAKASEVVVAFNMTASGLAFSIKDNGVGFDTTQKAKGIGLKNIDSRVAYYAGKVKLHSAPGCGTMLEIFMPL